VRRKVGSRGVSKPTAFAAFGLRLSMLAVAIALIAQTLAFGAHAARAVDGSRAAALALSRAVGSPVVLCVQDEDAPSDSGACHDACPLCHLASQTAALAAPEAPAQLAPPAPRPADRPILLADSRPHTEPIGLPFARGPPRSL
jgi:hypothetical protein